MNSYSETTSVPRVSHGSIAARASEGDARAFLAAVEADGDLTMKLADADGDMTSILAIAAEAGYTCTARELLAAYEDLARGGPSASVQDFGHPQVYLGLKAPSDLGHAAVYLSLRSS